jgi:transposase-like protein
MKTQQKEQALELRSAGHSIKQIAQQLGVARSSVSVWVRGIPLSPTQREQLAAQETLNRRRFAQVIGFKQALANKEEAELRHQRFRQQGFQQAQVDDRFRVICALYWGEGDKGKKDFRVSNSDPSLLNVLLRWAVQSGYDPAIRFSVRYHLNNGIDEEDIRRWWLQQMPLLRNEHLRSFFRCPINRASQQKNIGKLPYGTGNLVVHRAELFFKVMGGIDFLRQLGD